MNWKIKKFEELTTDELYMILKVRNEVFILEQTCPFLDCDDKDRKSFHMFLEEDNAVIAYCRLLPKGLAYKESSIGRVLVSKSYRGKDLAKQLMEKGINFILNNMKEREIKIQAQAYLFKFYSNFGFTPISEEYLEDNIPHIDMIYRI